ncbi:MAG: HNH endonuclease [Alphaproteobacteria bacterium]|nr:HNH endonuclease [Alphaproteobacteria bacterium]
MVAGPSIDRHHWVPRTEGGREAAIVHKICHRMLHRLVSERDLATTYKTPEAIAAHPDIRAFVAWVRRKPADFIDWPRAPAGSRNRRRPARR